jgi:septum formation protein
LTTLVLASTSPRRYHILALLNVPFLMVPPDVPEVLSTSRAPEFEVIHQAAGKAGVVAAQFPEALVLGSDTLISLDGEKIGKPKDAADAKAILQRLRGRTHEVLTGVAFVAKGGAASLEIVEVAQVTLHPFSDTEIEDYVATGDPLDKAGAYSIQGAGQGLVATVEGDFLAVVGLPLRAVAEGLRKMGVTTPVDVETLYRERDFLNWRTFA